YLENNYAIKITTHEDTDEVCVSSVRWVDRENSKGVDFFDKYLGKKVGWCWQCTNSQGYRDSFMISFDEVVIPQLMFIVVASSIEYREISKLE
ncbi:MAG: DUF6334 family protein, partial [Pseudomonadota bacterium]